MSLQDTETVLDGVPTVGAPSAPAVYSPPQTPAVSDGAGLLAVISRAAMDPRVDVDKFERLLAMQEKIEQTADRREFNAAVAAAKAEIGPILKAKEVDFTHNGRRTNYKYEDFAGIARAIGPALTQQGISYRFRSSQENGLLRVTCVVSRGGYSEETSLESKLDVGSGKNDIQALGSAVTYLQRYTLKLALGLAASADDDARTVAREEPPTRPSVITEGQIGELQSLIVEANPDPKLIEAFTRDMLKYVGAATIEAMTPAQFKKAADVIKAQIEDERQANLKGRAA